MRRLIIVLLSLTVLGAWSSGAGAAPKFARTAGNWSVNGNWSSVSCAAAGATTAPTAADDVTICNGIAITVDAPAKSALSVTIETGNAATSLTLATNLTVTNNVTINAPTANVLKEIAVGANTLAIGGSATITGGTTTGGASNGSQLTVTSGVVTIDGTLAITAGTVNTSVAQVTLTTGRISVTGNTTVTGGGAATRNALLTVSGAPAVSGNGINIGGALSVVSTVATTATVSVAGGVAGVINVTGAVTNGDTISVATGIFTATNAFTTTNNAIVTATTVTTGTLAIGTNATVAGGTTNPSGATMSVTTGILTVGGNLGITAGSNTNTSATVSATTGRITVTGDATVTGGAAAGRNALLTVTGAPAIAGNGININSDLSVVSTVATTATVSTTVVNAVVNVAGNVTNGDRITINTGIFNATGPGTSFTTTSNAIVTATAVTTGTLAIAGDAIVTGGTTTPSGATMSVTTGILTVGGNLEITAGSNTTTNATVSVTTGRITVTGNATLTGSAAAGVNRNALLTSTGIPAISGNGININGNLNVASHAGTPTATTATVSMTVAGVINVAGNVTNGDTILVNTGTFTVTGVSSTFANSNASIVANTTVTTGSLNLSGNTATLNNASGETMTITSTGSITVGNAGTNTGTLTNSGTITLTVGGTVNANGTFTNAAVTGTFTNTASGLLFLGGATSTVNGTFNRGTGTVTMDGIAAQTLSGSALNFHGFTVNNTAALATRTVTLGNDLTINNQLTFTSGRIVTGASKVILPSSALAVLGAAGSPDERFVAGNLQKFAAAGAPTVTFEIGSDGAAAPALGYSPVTLVFVGVAAGGGSLIGSVGLPLAEHPGIASSGVDSANSVNRWWSFTTTGVTGTVLPAFTSYSATATFLNPGDLDNPASTGSYEIERWDTGASTWNATTAGTRTGTTTQATGITALGQLAIGIKALPPGTGDLNAFETSTAALAVTGRVFTKLVSADFSLDVVAIVSGAQHTTFNKTVQVDLVTGASGGLGCTGTPVSIAGTTQSVALTNGRGTTASFNVASAVPDARVRIRYPVSSPTTTSCSTDNFSNRPTVLTVTSTDATQTDSSGSPAIKAGASFNLTATAVTGYTGTPAVDNTAGMVVGTPNAGTIGGTFNAASGGAASGSAFTYSQVGNFGLSANAVFDTGFTTVDQAGGDCVAGSFSTTLSGGRYGCLIGSTAVPLNVAPSGGGGTGFGRFTPDNFGVSYSVTPQFTMACGGFGYVGMPFAYGAGTAPQITVTARNSSNATTTNYAGSYVKLTNASLTPGTQGARYSRFDALGGGATPALDTAGLPATTADPAISSFTNGVGTLTFSSGATGLAFVRSATTPNAPFNADIALALNVIDADGVAFAGNPAAFGTATLGGGIGFSIGNEMRFGRIRIINATGVANRDLNVQIRTEYWNGTSFNVNTADNCTTLARANITLANYAKNLNACETRVITTPVTFAAGLGTLLLRRPGNGNEGSVTLIPQLGTTPSGDYCNTVGGAETPSTAAGMSYLQGAWTGADYDQNPSGRAAFGTYGAKPKNYIFFRERY